MWIASVEAKGIGIREQLTNDGKRELWKRITSGLDRVLFREFTDVEKRIEELKRDSNVVANEIGMVFSKVNCFVPGFEKLKYCPEEDDVWFFAEGLIIVKFTKMHGGIEDTQQGWQRKAVENAMGGV